MYNSLPCFDIKRFHRAENFLVWYYSPISCEIVTIDLREEVRFCRKLMFSLRVDYCNSRFFVGGTFCRTLEVCAIFRSSNCLCFVVCVLQNFLKMLEVFERASCAMKLMLKDRDLRVFEGVETESEAVDLLAKGDAAREGNRILAGANLPHYWLSQSYFTNQFDSVIVFDVNEHGRIGSHVSYKIRQAQSETADTRFVRSPYW